MTDLTLIYDEHNFSGENINSNQLCLVGKILERIKYYQEIEYQIEDDQVLNTFLKELAFLDDEALYQLSLTREPRNTDYFDVL